VKLACLRHPAEAGFILSQDQTLEK
jgi:hypothetical protein